MGSWLVISLLGRPKLIKSSLFKKVYAHCSTVHISITSISVICFKNLHMTDIKVLYSFWKLARPIQSQESVWKKRLGETQFIIKSYKKDVFLFATPSTGGNSKWKIIGSLLDLAQTKIDLLFHEIEQSIDSLFYRLWQVYLESLREGCRGSVCW